MPLPEPLPERLKVDGIREVVLDIRFNSPLPAELVMATLLNSVMGLEKGGKVQRLPAADLPAPMRRADPNLTYQPTLQVNFPNGRIIRLGEQAISYHALQPYPGWKVLSAEVAAAVMVSGGRNCNAGGKGCASAQRACGGDKDTEWASGNHAGSRLQQSGRFLTILKASRQGSAMKIDTKALRACFRKYWASRKSFSACLLAALLLASATAIAPAHSETIVVEAQGDGSSRGSW